MDYTTHIPTLDDVRAAAERIAPHAHRTPVLRSRSLDALAGCELHFKCEHLQRVGAFKFRGACNAVFSLTDEEAARGVVTQSSGNHGAAVALACRLRGISATVVVPH
ncbi:MAG TPA: pyridoxal-phosphate dependent enzyme, partial [Myxococcaceae bacterium]|nr:pyridoxal-phosphate dependent enzyme [Myxococcaceae bacterium]